ncbi:MAG TPA: hypothetical protein VM846_11985 [Vicinamibacterales bacterium]|jgi:hypothetical protein|nr:hypothetical protein [Vicinamibacterales bacterium]
MDVRTFPNWTRPGVGMKPRRENQRPLLPQHARHCPVLEAGSGLGYMVYPALEPHESYHVEFQGEGQYQFTYFMQAAAARWQPIFSLTIAMPVGGIGVMKEQVQFQVPDPPLDVEEAKQFARVFIVPEDMGTPQGAITLRGNMGFRTPEGWDTVYTQVFNNVERPIAPMLVVRVETDWYVHDSEFRYVLQPGEGIAGAHNLPIGQVFFVSREEITLQECNDSEIAVLRQAKANFLREKTAHKVTTPHGLHYSPHYLRESRGRKG